LYMDIELDFNHLHGLHMDIEFDFIHLHDLCMDTQLDLQLVVLTMIDC